MMLYFSQLSVVAKLTFWAELSSSYPFPIDYSGCAGCNILTFNLVLVDSVTK